VGSLLFEALSTKLISSQEKIFLIGPHIAQILKKARDPKTSGGSHEERMGKRKFESLCRFGHSCVQEGWELVNVL
jgi:hypothetical protein